MERYRIVEGHALYFLTFTIVHWLPVFISEEPCRIVTESLNFCHHNKGLRINAFVIMPTHLHLIAFDETFDADRLQRALADFRKFTGRQLADYCASHLPDVFSDVFRKEAGEDRERRFWQSSRHPEAIFSQPFWEQKVDYIHANPVTAGLVHQADHWRFSSAAYWLGKQDVGASDVILSDIEW
jgi:REP element-mobilizing transposase RayT